MSSDIVSFDKRSAKLCPLCRLLVSLYRFSINEESFEAMRKVNYLEKTAARYGVTEVCSALLPSTGLHLQVIIGTNCNLS